LEKASKSASGRSIRPPLRAEGGWLNAGGFCRLTQGAGPARVDSWVFDSADSIPIGDCAFRILELQLQFGRDCREGFSALRRARKQSKNNQTGFVCPHFQSPHLQCTYASLFPASVSYLGALGDIASRGAFGFVLLSAVSWLWPFGRQEYKNGYPEQRRCPRAS
jgi:hypothetical protein